MKNAKDVFERVLPWDFECIPDEPEEEDDDPEDHILLNIWGAWRTLPAPSG